nr:MFS transporter [Komagataeibacter melomenusus]
MAGLLVGLDTGLIAEALGFIGHDFHAGARAQEWIVSVLMIGALLGSLGAGVFSRRFGRRLALGTATLLIGAGALLCATAGLIGQILLGRFLIGVAIGICTFTAPLPAWRETGPWPVLRVPVVGQLGHAALGR